MLLALPRELVVAVLQHAAGSLAELRLVDSALSSSITEHRCTLLRSLCLSYDISDQLLDQYCHYHEVSPSDISALLRLNRELAAVQAFGEDCRGHQKESFDGIAAGMVRFSMLTASLRGSWDFPQPLQDALTSSVTIDGIVPKALSISFKQLLKDQCSLTDLESIIAAINVTASKLWSSVFLHRTSASRVNTFASLSGHTFNIEQAILTEHVIWHGPTWAASLLKEAQPSRATNFELQLQEYGPWAGTKEDGARLAANGLARLLWKERQRKVDEERERQAQLAGQKAVSSLAINPAVWRGSAGDM